MPDTKKRLPLPRLLAWATEEARTLCSTHAPRAGCARTVEIREVIPWRASDSAFPATVGELEVI